MSEMKCTECKEHHAKHMDDGGKGYGSYPCCGSERCCVGANDGWTTEPLPSLVAPQPPTYPHAGAFLRALREAAGVTLREAARRLQHSPAYVSLVERGGHNVPPDGIARWAQAYGCTPREVAKYWRCPHCGERRTTDT